MTTTPMPDHDPIDDLVRAARPAAPARLAPAIASRLAARRRARFAAITSAVVLGSAATVAVLLVLGSAGDSGPGELASRAVAPAPDALGAPAVPPVPDASVPPLPSWHDLPALIADLERTQHAALAACAPPSKLRSLAHFQVTRGPDGKTSPPRLILHHSLGYLGYTTEERCLADLGLAMVVPPLPDALASVVFWLDRAPTPPADPAWKDPVRTATDLMAPVQAKLAACRDGSPVGVTVVFEATGKTFHGRLVLSDYPNADLKQCLAGVPPAIEMPALPDRIAQIVFVLR
jgi:hypothetical protein